MNDRMDELLARLPTEPPASDLAPRIMAAVAMRRRAQARWRRVGVLASAGLVTGTSLVVVSWAKAAALLTPHLPAVPDASSFYQASEAFLASPMDSLAGWISSALSLQTVLAEGLEVAFSLGVVLLAVAALGGLAQLLSRSAPLNGTSH